MRRKKSILLIAVAFVGFLAYSAIQSEAKDEKGSVYQTKFEDLIASVNAPRLIQFESVQHQYIQEKKKLSAEMLTVFENPESSNLAKCASAYYLGELGVGEAAGPLTGSISLMLDSTLYPGKDFSILTKRVAVEALVKLGTSSIPHLIHRLELGGTESQRDFVLQAIYGIEGDKDVVLLRLKKAWASQTDSEKKQRLQSAIDTVSEKFGK